MQLLRIGYGQYLRRIPSVIEQAEPGDVLLACDWNRRRVEVRFSPVPPEFLVLSIPRATPARRLRPPGNLHPARQLSSAKRLHYFDGTGRRMFVCPARALLEGNDLDDR